MTEEGAQPVPPEPKYTLPSNGHTTSALVKCTDCDLVTHHDVMEIRPIPLLDNPPVSEILKKIKRVLMCTNCAKISLKK